MAGRLGLLILSIILVLISQKGVKCVECNLLVLVSNEVPLKLIQSSEIVNNTHFINCVMVSHVL